MLCTLKTKLNKYLIFKPDDPNSKDEISFFLSGDCSLPLNEIDYYFMGEGNIYAVHNRYTRALEAITQRDVEWVVVYDLHFGEPVFMTKAEFDDEYITLSHEYPTD